MLDDKFIDKIYELEVETASIREINLSHIMERLEKNEAHIRGIDLRTQLFVPKRTGGE